MRFVPLRGVANIAQNDIILLNRFVLDDFRKEWSLLWKQVNFLIFLNL